MVTKEGFETLEQVPTFLSRRQKKKRGLVIQFSLFIIFYFYILENMLMIFDVFKFIENRTLLDIKRKYFK